MIKFHTVEANEKELSFDMVENGQFFIDQDGWLCQKTDANSFVPIADEEGKPYPVQYCGMPVSLKITKIMPLVTKITWE